MMRKFKIACIIIIKSLLKVWLAILFSLFITAIGFVVLLFTYTDGLSAFLIGILSSLFVTVTFYLADSYKKQLEYKDKVLNILINMHREYAGKNFKRHILKKAFNKYYAELLSSAVEKLYYNDNFDEIVSKYLQLKEHVENINYPLLDLKQELDKFEAIAF
ncbi:MAG: hypothetical protein NC131_04855 [Roseburia sp.]|nr:hypothetical protein [Roseburia sp.]